MPVSTSNSVLAVPPAKPGTTTWPGDGVGILPQGVEVGQGVVLRCESESVAVRDIGEGLIHHHNDVHILPQTGVAALVPAGRLRPAEALRLVHRVGGELVAEAVGEPQLVEHGGNIVGVRHPEGVVQIIGGIDCQDQSCQHGKAGGSPQQASHPAAEPGDGEGAAAHEEPQGHQHQREHHDGGDGRHRELDVVSPHSAARFFQQGKVPGKHRLVPYLDLDAVGDRQGADGEVRQRPAKNTFRSRQVNTSSSIPTGRQFRIISSGCARKTARTLRRALGWHQSASRVMAPASSTAARSVAHRGSRTLGKWSWSFKSRRSFLVGFPHTQNTSIIRIFRKKARLLRSVECL